MKNWRKGLVVTVAALTLVGCGGNEFGWEDAGDYDAADHEVDDRGRSLVAEDVIAAWADEHVTGFGDPVRGKVRHDPIVDDFGDTYPVQYAVQSYVYDVPRSRLDVLGEILGTTGWDCTPREDDEDAEPGVVESCLALPDLLDDLPPPLSLDLVEWRKHDDGRTQAEIYFTYDPRREGR